MINIVVAGANGRMGTLIIKQIGVANGCVLAGTADIDAPLENVIDKADVVIDFTTADAAARHATLAAEHRKPIVIGTTGLDEAQRAEVHKASKRTAVLHAPNMSLGVNLLFHLVKIASQRLGTEFVVDVLETHHTKKIDRPSGTAVRIADVVIDARNLDRERDVVVVEEQEPNGKHPLTVSSFRKGDVVGDHAVRFSSNEEVLEINHCALTRELFARGAVVAARWIADKPAGQYERADVLNLR